MIDRYDILTISEKQQELFDIANWAWNSHYWVEYHPGYCECKWCGNKHTSEMGITHKFPLCKENPAIKTFIEKEINGK